MQVLIVKTSSLGDIVQTFHVLDELSQTMPTVAIDWVVEASLASIVAAHPLVRHVIPVHWKEWKKGWNQVAAWRQMGADIRALRRVEYDLIFDLQGNTKSACLTGLALGKTKIGLGRKSVREWPNLLATKVRFEVAKELNIRLQHVDLLRQFFHKPRSVPFMPTPVRFKIAPSEEEKIEAILSDPILQKPLRVMVCPGSKWSNKQLSTETLIAFLSKIQTRLKASFLLMWGDLGEQALCAAIEAHFPSHATVIDKLPLPTWQRLMDEMDLVIAVDSSALHLCGTTSVPSFSLFGPTNHQIFKPVGARHFAFQGSCPYGRTFQKQCPLLRSCETGACIRGVAADPLFDAFLRWWEDYLTT